MQYSSAAGRWVVVATALGSGMAAIDATVVGIALPSIGRDLHASVDSLQWVVSGYTLTLGAFLIPSGTLADRFGRRALFNIGVVWFAGASALCAVAPNTTVLIATRVVQGVGAALLTPASLAIIQASFDDESRGRAVGAWSALGGVATAAGPLVGGYLIAAATWRWIFVINVPIGAAVLLISSRHMPESRDATAVGRVDVSGAVFAVAALTGITYGLIEGPAIGWDRNGVVMMLALGAIGAAAFLIAERRTAHPMLPLSVFGERQFTVTNGVTFIIYAALGGALFLFPVELQVVGRYTPFESGVSLLPLTVVMLLLSARSGRLASRIGPRLQMSVGPVVVAAGLALLTRATTDRSYASGVLPAVLVFGLGLAITVAPLTATALGALSSDHAGLASAVNNDVARIGGLLAVASFPAIAGIVGSNYLNPAVVGRGFRTDAFIAAGCCALAGMIAAVGIRNPRRAEPVAPCLHCPLDATPLGSRAG
ncbi:MAG: MFS transporter [Acidimicrobiales bacterium]|nr:MFS transporter [Acidimicrobiales bacterium]